MAVAQRLPSIVTVIRARWFVVLTIAVVAAIGAIVYRDETDRSEKTLELLGARQAELARVVAIAPDKAQLERSIVITEPFPIPLPKGTPYTRISREDAAKLGLPARTAMAGFAITPTGQRIAVVTSAEHQRDLDFATRNKVLFAMMLAAGVMTTFTIMMWRRQRHEAGLERDLAVAETARARDAELDRLHRAATMAALGSGVAHELSTPLGVIVGRAEQLQARFPDDERAQKALATILEQTNHMNDVVRGLLGLARGAPIAMQPARADAIVKEATALVEHRFARAHVTLEEHITGQLPEIRCEPLLFKHALVNLLLNACDAAPAKSTVRVDVGADARQITFAVTDEGEGITPDHAARVTEPFFTTKPTGTGLGLAIVNEIAKTHRGTLDLAQITPHGTRASITIPLEAA
ncbi:MAG: ATP-binding protein [Kofleriaceae bacterium]